MRPIPTLAIFTLLACGPLAPPFDVGTTTDASTTTSVTTTTARPPDPTTVSPTTTGVDPTAEPTTAEPTTAAGTTEIPDFIITPDGGNSTIQCDVLAQNCDPGQKCVPWAEGGGTAWNASKCVDITGDGAPGDPCTATGGGVSGIDDCGFGAICWDVDENNHGTCIAQCLGTWESLMCPPKSSCAIASEGVLALCIPTCEPLLQDCPGDDLCIPNGDSFLCVLDASGEEGQTNDPCEFANSCDKGLVCLNTVAASSACQQGSAGCCEPFCTFPDSPCPNPDQQCVQWFDPMMPIPPGLENVGVCAIPS